MENELQEQAGDNVSRWEAGTGTVVRVTFYSTILNS